MIDPIERQDAINEVVAWLKDRMTVAKNGKPLTERLRDLLPAQPEFIRCKDCKYTSGDDYCHCKYVTWWNSPDDYCSRAERREE